MKMLGKGNTWQSKAFGSWPMVSAMLCVFFCLFSSHAYAQTPYGLPAGCSGYAPPDLGGPPSLPHSVTTAFVNCVDSTIRNVVYGASGSIMHVISVHMTPIVQALSVLFIAVHAIKILGGVSNLTYETAKMMIALAGVNFFFYDLGGMAAAPFNIMDELQGVVGQGFTPWGDLDLLFGMIFGVDPDNGASMGVVNHTTGAAVTVTGANRTLVNGMIALLGTTAFAGAPGLMLSLTGVLAFFELISFVLDIIYTYFLAELLLGLCVVVSPIMVPLTLFQYSKRYFDKWISTMLGAMLVPAFLFGFLYLMINMICQPIYDALNYLNPAGYTDENGNPSYVPYSRQNQSAVSWTQDSAGAFAGDIAKNVNTASNAASGSNAPNTPAVGAFMDSRGSTKTLANYSFLGAVDATSWGINLVGPPPYDNADINIRNAMFSLFTLWVYVSVLTGLISNIPDIAQEICGGAMSIMRGQSLSDRFAGAHASLNAGGGSFMAGMSRPKTAPPPGDSAAAAGAAMGKLVGPRSTL